MHLKSEAIKEIEKKLNEVLYDGIPMGSTIAHILHLSLYSSKTNMNILQFSKENLRYYKYRYFSDKYFKKTKYSKKIDYKKFYNRHLINLTSEDERYTGLVFPVIDEFNKNDVVIFSKRNIKVNENKMDFAKIYFEDLQGVSKKKWQQKINKAEPLWQKVITEFRKKNKLTFFWEKYILNLLIIQSQRALQIEELFNRICPVSVLVEFDRNQYSSLLVLTARKYKIPSFTMIHGVTEPPDIYIPFLADYIFCWGQKHFDQFQQLRVSNERLIISGFQKVNDIMPDKNITRKKYKIFDKDFTVILATNPIPVIMRQKLADDFASAVKAVQGIKGIIRLHPSEKKSVYDIISIKHPEIIITEKNEMSLLESLSIADLIVVNNSNYANDAVFCEKAIIVLDSIEHHLSFDKMLVEKGKIPKVSNKKELIDEFEKHLNDPKYLYSKIQNIKTYKSYLYAYTGKQAALNIKKAIYTLTKIK